MVFLDANILIYFLDETADQHQDVVQKMQKLVDEQEQLVTSHHVIEEVLFILSKYDTSANLGVAIDKISAIPELMLVEPSPNILFAKRYARLSKQLNMGLNDALLLQLILDAGIHQLFTYDRKFLNKATNMGISGIV